MATNRFHAGSLARRLAIPTPSAWQEDAEQEAPPAQAELPLLDDDDERSADQVATAPPPAFICYPLMDHLKATHPALGRPGLAMILRAARRGGSECVLRMVAALCRDSERQQQAAWQENRTPAAARLIALASQRPLRREEVAEYLRYQRRLTGRQPATCAASQRHVAATAIPRQRTA